MDKSTPEELVERISTIAGVVGVIVASKDGQPVHSTMDNTSTVNYIANLTLLEQIASSIIRDVDPTDSLLTLRVRSHRCEVLVKPDQYSVIYAVQKISPSTNTINAWNP